VYWVTILLVMAPETGDNEQTLFMFIRETQLHPLYRIILGMRDT